MERIFRTRTLVACLTGTGRDIWNCLKFEFCDARQAAAFNARREVRLTYIDNTPQARLVRPCPGKFQNMHAALRLSASLPLFYVCSTVTLQ